MAVAFALTSALALPACQASVDDEGAELEVDDDLVDGEGEGDGGTDG